MQAHRQRDRAFAREPVEVAVDGGTGDNVVLGIAADSVSSAKAVGDEWLAKHARTVDGKVVVTTGAQSIEDSALMKQSDPLQINERVVRHDALADHPADFSERRRGAAASARSIRSSSEYWSSQ